MNQTAINHIWEFANNPEYIHYLEVTIPRWLSYMPQGTNYEVTRTSEELAAKFYEQCLVIAGMAVELGVLLDGFPRGKIERRTPESLARKYSTPSNRQHFIKRWKDNLRTLGLSIDESVYMTDKGTEEYWDREWNHFNESTRTLYPVEETADVE